MPTEKQLNYIAVLLHVRDNAYHSAAYAEIARVCGYQSMSRAAKKATRQDATDTIEALLQSTKE